MLHVCCHLGMTAHRTGRVPDRLATLSIARVWGVSGLTFVANPRTIQAGLPHSRHDYSRHNRPPLRFSCLCERFTTNTRSRRVFGPAGGLIGMYQDLISDADRYVSMQRSSPLTLVLGTCDRDCYDDGLWTR